MHELGVVFHIIRDLKKVAEENSVDTISRVTLQLGEVSTVIPRYLTDCWKWASAKEPLLCGAELAIETIPAVTRCDDCENEYPTVAYGKTCPRCGGGNTWLLRGGEFMIKEIEVPEPEGEAANGME